MLLSKTGYTTICVTFMVDCIEDMTSISDFREVGGLEDSFCEISASIIVRSFIFCTTSPDGFIKGN